MQQLRRWDKDLHGRSLANENGAIERKGNMNPEKSKLGSIKFIVSTHIRDPKGENQK